MKLVLLISFLAFTGCASYKVMKDCKPLNPQDAELSNYYACKKQNHIH